MTLTLGIGRSFVRTVGTGVAHGPTVQIASVPATLSLAHGVTGSALAGTPEDINGVATGARKYYHSSDATIVTVDPDTGVPTGVAAGSATITENFVAPPASELAEPVYTGAVTQDLIFGVGNDLGVAGGTTIASMFATNSVAPPERFRPTGSDTYWNSLTTRLDGTGVGLKMHGEPDGGGGYSYGNFQLVPTDDNIGNPGRGPVFNTMACHFIQHRMKVDVDPAAYPLTTPVRIKGNEFIHTSQTHRIQCCTVNFRRPGVSRLTHYQFLDSATWGWDTSLAADTTDPFDGGPLAGGSQVLGPYFNEDIVNSGKVFRLTHQYQPNSISPGTVDVLLQYGHFWFLEDLVGAGVTNGSRIKITGCGSVEFVITELSSGSFGSAQTHGYIVRQVGTTGATVTATTYTSGMGDFSGAYAFGDIGQTAHFSLSQAGILSSGTNGGYVTVYQGAIGYVWRVKDFDGDKTCTLIKDSSDYYHGTGNINTDLIGVQFNNTQDGIARLWIAEDTVAEGLGTLVIDVSQTGIGVTPPGGEGQYCSRQVIASLSINNGIQWWWLMGAQTQGPAIDYTYYGPSKWWVTGGRGSYP